MKDHQKSPFKFLDSYQQEDMDVFFGREKETEELYEALSGVKHLLVYGPSGAGKTSLIECGLRNQFSDADWFALTIRRGNNLSASVFSSINDVLKQKVALHPKTNYPLDKEIGFGAIIERLFDEKFQPIYLLFDQFEELLISGTEQEKVDFFLRLNLLIRYKVPCRVLLIMREEFIGHLSEFEHLCPSIFHHRFRLEKMNRSSVENVILSILRAPRYAHSFTVENSEGLAKSILSNLPDDKKEIELTHVQVFLSELWDRGLESDYGGGKVVLNEALLNEEDNLESVLDSFLKKQLDEMAERYGTTLPLEVLAVLISERYTKIQNTQEEIEADLKTKGVKFGDELPELLKELENRRIIRTLKISDETQYEISHDLLALVVGQNLTEEMKLRDRAEHIYSVYLERSGEFSQADIDYLRPFQEYKAYPKELKRRIDQSIARIEEIEIEEKRQLSEQARKEKELRTKAEAGEKKARRITRVASFVALLAIGAASAALYFFQDASLQKRSAEAAKNEALKEKSIAVEALRVSDSLTREREAMYNELLEQQGITEAALEDLKQEQVGRRQAEEAQEKAEREKIPGEIEKINKVLLIGDKDYAQKLLNDLKAQFPNEPQLLELQKRINEN